MGQVSLTKKNFNGGEFSPDLFHRSDLEPYASGCKTVLNWIPRVEGGADNRAGLHMVNETKFSGASVSRVVRFVFSVQQAYVLEFGDFYVRVYANDGIVLNGLVPVEVATPYAAADVALLKFEQSADTLTITHPSYPTAHLTRTSSSTFTYSAVSFTPTQAAPTALSSGGTGSSSYVVTAVATSQIESIPSNVITGTNTTVLTWTAPTGTQPDHYNVYVNTNGTYYYVGKTNGNVLTFTMSASLSQNSSLSPPALISPFTGANNYPGCSAYFGGRQIFARTNNQPQTLFGSVVADFSNMNYSSPSQDDDAFTFTINSRQVNEIRWMVALKVLIIGTSGGEFVLQPGAGSPTVTPTSVDLQPQSNYGVSDVPPILIGHSVLFVEGSGKVVRKLSYSLADDAYDGTDVSILARHLFKNTPVLQWDYQQYPPSVIWAVRSDGVLCGLTFYEEHKVAGWSRHTTQGTFESVAVIPLPTGDKEVWFIVNRTINGVSRRFVERMDNREFTNLADAYFVDCGLTYAGPPATTFSGINHLAGMSVAVFADGSVVPGITVSTSGTITLPNAASKVCVGLPYNCDLETLDFTTPLPGGGDLASNKRQVVSVTLSLSNTRQAFVGPSADRLTEVRFRQYETLGTPTNAFTGDRENIAIRPGNNNSSSVFVRTTDPVPISVESLTAIIDYGDR